MATLPGTFYQVGFVTNNLWGGAPQPQQLAEGDWGVGSLLPCWDPTHCSLPSRSQRWAKPLRIMSTSYRDPTPVGSITLASPPPQIVTTGEADEDPEYVPLVTGKDMPTRRRLEVGPGGKGGRR